MYIRTYVCVFTHTHTHTHKQRHKYIPTYVYTYIHIIHTYIHTYMYVCVCVCVSVADHSKARSLASTLQDAGGRTLGCNAMCGEAEGGGEGGWADLVRTLERDGPRCVISFYFSGNGELVTWLMPLGGERGGEGEGREGELEMHVTCVAEDFIQAFASPSGTPKSNFKSSIWWGSIVQILGH